VGIRGPNLITREGERPRNPEGYEGRDGVGVADLTHLEQKEKGLSDHLKRFQEGLSESLWPL